MSIRWKMTLAFLAMALVGAAQGFYLSANTTAMANLVARVFEGPMTSVEHARAAMQRFGDADRHVASVLSMTHVVDSATSRAELDQILREFDQHMAMVAGAADLAEAKTTIQRVVADSQAWRQVAAELIGSNGATSIASPHYRQRLVDTMTSQLNELVALTIGEAHHMKADAVAAADAARIWGLIMIAAAGALAVAIGLAIAQSLMSPLRRLGQRMTDLAEGEIDRDVPFVQRRDEIGTMARTVEVFRTNAMQIQALNEQKERDSRAVIEGDKERRRQEGAVLSEVVKLVEEVSAGDLTRRLATNGQDGLFRSLAEQLNQLVDRLDEVLGEINEQIAAMSRGDLTKRLAKTYQGRFADLKDNANGTAETLGRIVGEIQTAAAEVTNAAAEINSGTEDLARRTEQAASNIEETAASMEEMAATVKQNAENAQNASRLAGDANGVAARGGQIVGDAVTAMAGIKDSSQRIADIVSVIDGIAFQTNLLALNASVEAARAGEAGKGFAVVASEVRALAQRAAQAAGDIKVLIQESGGRVKDGVQLVNQAGETLKEIVASIGQVANLVGDISTATREQTSGIEEINISVTQMDEMTQQNAALVEESTASVRALGDQAEKLADMIAFFKLDQLIEPKAHANQMGRSTERRADHVGCKQQKARSATPARSIPALRISVEPNEATTTAADQDWAEF